MEGSPVAQNAVPAARRSLCQGGLPLRTLGVGVYTPATSAPVSCSCSGLMLRPGLCLALTARGPVLSRRHREHSQAHGLRHREHSQAHGVGGEEYRRRHRELGAALGQQPAEPRALACGVTSRATCTLPRVHVGPISPKGGFQKRTESVSYDEVSMWGLTRLD